MPLAGMRAHLTPNHMTQNPHKEVTQQQRDRAALAHALRRSKLAQYASRTSSRREPTYVRENRRVSRRPEDRGWGSVVELLVLLPAGLALSWWCTVGRLGR